MPTLTALAGWEEAILASLKGATGTIEAKDVQIRRSGLYAEYPAVLHGYLERLAVEADAMEALKRAVFLVWFGAIEAPPLSGIGELPERYARETMELVEERARSGRLDEEFRMMLAWYQSVLALPFELFGANRFVLDIGRAVPADAWRHHFQAAQFEDRGQLGHYWRSMISTVQA